jgi:hypothetical protein
MSKKSKQEKEKRFEELNKIANEIITNTQSDAERTFWEAMNKIPKKDRSKNLDRRLANYHILIESVVGWNFCHAYLNLLQQFLRKEIEGTTFRFEFLVLRAKNMSKVTEISDIIEEEQKPIPDFYYTSKSEDFTSAIDDIYFEIDLYNSDREDSDWDEFTYSESKLRSVIQEQYVPIFQKSCDLENSFFQPKIDLD